MGLGGFLTASGHLGFEPDQCRVHQPAQVGHQPVLRPGDRGLGVDERDGFTGRCMVCLAILRAFHACNNPCCTSAQSLGEAVAELQRAGDQTAAER